MFCVPEIVLDKVTNTLNTLRLEKELTDVVLICGKEEFPAHKIVLAASSPYFHHLFGDKTRSNDILQLTGIESQALEKLLDYIYMGKLNLPTEINKIEENLFASNQLQIIDFSKHAEIELSTRVTVYNYMIFWIMADQYGADYLQNQVECFAASNLKKLFKSDDFKSLEGKFLLRICERAALSGVNPKTVIAAVLQWFNNDLNGRKIHMTSIVPYLRMERLDCSILHELWEKEPLVHKIKALSNEVKRALKLKCQGAGEHSFCSCSALHTEFANSIEKKSLGRCKVGSIPVPVPFSCSSRSRNKMIVSYGTKHENLPFYELSSSRKCQSDDGDGDDESESTEEFTSEDENDTSNYISTTEDDDHFKTQPKNCPTLVIIGRKRSNSVTVRALDLDNSIWLPPSSSKTQLLFQQGSISILTGSANAVVDNFLYLAGGYDAAQRVSDTFLVYCVFTAQLTRLPDMLTARALSGADFLGKYLYVVGGMGMFGKALNLVERYDFEKKIWQYVSPMPKPCWEMGVTSCRGRLYSLGGRVKGQWTSTCLCYNPDYDQWQHITVLPKEYYNTHPVVSTYKETIYSIGHHNPQHKASIYKFDPICYHWTCLKAVRTNSTKIFAFLPWRGNLWAIETTGSVHVYQIGRNKWGTSNSFGKGIVFPLYAAILLRNKTRDV